MKSNSNDIAEKFNESADKYDSQRRCFIPRFDDFYESGIEILRKSEKTVSSVLDLGAGTGILSMFLHKYYPSAGFTLADISDKMLDVAKKRFAGHDNFSYLESDYSVSFPEGNYDLIVSGLSIHHLSDTDKEKLYSRAIGSLNSGGIFLNLDQFNSSSASINSCYDKCWFDYIGSSGIDLSDKDAWLKRKALDKENTVEETLSMLRRAGFSSSDCVYRYMKFAVIVAEK